MARQVDDVNDPLAGITTKTTRAEILDRLRKVAGLLRTQEDEKLSRLQEIEERVRQRYANAGADYQLRQLIVTASVDEWRQTMDFLDNFEEILPPALFRIFDGARAIIDYDENPA